MTDSSRDADADEKRAQAVKFARSLLPRLGQDNIIGVMALVLDCVETGEMYIDHKFIAGPDMPKQVGVNGFERWTTYTMEFIPSRYGPGNDETG